MILFGSELFSTVNYLDDSTRAFSHLFLNNFHQSVARDIYKKSEFYEHVQYAHKQVRMIEKCEYSRTSIIRTIQLSGLFSLVPFVMNIY